MSEPSELTLRVAKAIYASDPWDDDLVNKRLQRGLPGRARVGECRDASVGTEVMGETDRAFAQDVSLRHNILVEQRS